MTISTCYSQIVEPLPQFPGGEEALSKYLEDNLERPAMAKESSIEGKVVVGFFVEKNGKITHIKVLKSTLYLFEEEAVRVVKEMPRWIPAKLGDKPISVPYYITIYFTFH